MWGIDVSLIKGLMFGIEYAEDPEEQMFYVVVDVGFFRFLYLSGPAEE